MQEMELYLKYMNALKGPQHSIDIYFNNLAPEFVVKVTDHFESENTRHFRNPGLKQAITDAVSFFEAEAFK